MASANKKANDTNMKQKSLMSFFGKPAAGKFTSSQNPARQSNKQTSSASSASKLQNPTTPEAKSSDILAPTSSAGGSTGSSGGCSSVKQTPPTSDLVDVDMLSAEEDAKERVQTKGVRASEY